MAEAMLNFRGAGRFQALSGGIVPAGSVHAMVVEALQEARITTKKLRSKSWEDSRDEPLDAVITLCDFAREKLDKKWPPSVKGTFPIRVHWPFPDPSAVETPGRVMTQEEHLAAFRETRDELREYLEDLMIAPFQIIDDDVAFANLLHQIAEDLEWEDDE